MTVPNVPQRVYTASELRTNYVDTGSRFTVEELIEHMERGNALVPFDQVIAAGERLTSEWAGRSPETNGHVEAGANSGWPQGFTADELRAIAIRSRKTPFTVEQLLDYISDDQPTTPADVVLAEIEEMVRKAGQDRPEAA